jgi:hypothetical protein
MRLKNNQSAEVLFDELDEMESINSGTVEIAGFGRFAARLRAEESDEGQYWPEPVERQKPAAYATGFTSR